jgi:hypothetical protein
MDTPLSLSTVSLRLLQASAITAQLSIKLVYELKTSLVTTFLMHCVNDFASFSYMQRRAEGAIT